MKNKLTIFVDGGWHLMRCLYFHEKGFDLSNPTSIRQATAAEFKKSLSRTFVSLLNKFKNADNIIIASEGGSWRKTLDIPKQLYGEIYKGNRKKESSRDWSLIYNTYKEFTNSLENNGITHLQGPEVEADDWAYYCSRRINELGSNMIIMSADCDLKQIVQQNGSAFTGWYNDRAGLYLPEILDESNDIMDFMLSIPNQNRVLESIKKDIQFSNIHYINPEEIVINKVLMGDRGDNIKSCVYYKMNNKTYGLGQKDYESLVKDLNINSIDDLKNKQSDIVNYILRTKKFGNKNIPALYIHEMLDYNLQLVWLDRSVMPDYILELLNTNFTYEYKVPENLQELKSNYKLLDDPNSTIEMLFDDIFS